METLRFTPPRVLFFIARRGRDTDLLIYIYLFIQILNC